MKAVALTFGFACLCLLGCTDSNQPPRAEGSLSQHLAAIEPTEAARGNQTASSPGKRISSTDTKDWLQFRGGEGLGTSGETRLPVTWGPDENIVWKTELPGAGTSSPILIGDRIYLTCYSGFGIPEKPQGSMNDLKLHIVCLNRKDGAIRWTRPLEPKLPEQQTIRDEHGYSSSTPVADDERVYVFFGKTGVFAFSHDGERLWHADVGSKLNGWGSAASPILYGDLVIVNASVESDSLVALNKTTGEEKWRTGGIREAWNTPLLAKAPDGKTELVVPIIRNILGFDPATGEKLWTCDTGIDWYMVPCAVAQDGIVYCIGGRTGGALAVRAGGRGNVEQSHRLWTGKKGSNVSSPIAHNGHMYWMHDSQGIAYCASLSTGDIVYEQRIPRADQVYASPVLGDGKLYYVSRGGRTFVIAAQPEFKLLATNELEQRGRFDASPAIADGRLFIRSNRFLYCIGVQ
jgi:outer membrane protein assembly factor BamB